MLELGCAPAWPWQAEVITAQVVAGFFVFAAFGLERLDVKHMHVAHVGFQAFRALAGVTDGPDALVDLAQDVFWHGLVHALDLLHLVVLGEFFGKAKFLSQLMHDHVVRAALPQRLDDFFAPLDGAVGSRDGATGLKLCGGRQQVNSAVGVEVFRFARHGSHGGCGRWVRVNDNQQVQLVHGAFHFQATTLRVRCMAPEHAGLEVGVLVNQLVFLQHTVNPARHGDTRLAHHRG